jgi:4-hydroxyphenylpyruvate dioxygenase
MERCIASISVNGALRTKIRAIADAGFEYVEVFENDLLSSPEPAAVIGAMMRDLGLSCVAFQPFRDFEGMPRHLRSRVFDRAERKFDVLAELGTDLMLVSSNVSPEALSDCARVVDDFRELGERAAQRGLRVAYEALPWARHVRDHRDAWRIVREVNHPAVGLALDAFSSLAPGIAIESLEAIDMARVFHVQIADAPRLTMDAQSWSRHFRCMPGQGELPLVEFVRVLKRRGYDGILSLEIFNDRFRAGSTADIALDGMRSLDYLLEQAGRDPGSGAVRDERAQCHGVEFIEFSAGEEEARQLGQMLRNLGFAPTHRHVRKAVTRWRQGDINIVVNCEPEGFAHSYGTLHGASVCAIGLRVEDPDAALRRAHRLQVQSFSQPVGPGEYEIPALRAVGGSLLYLMPEKESPSIWRDEFEELPRDPTVRDAGLKRIDHFSQNMQYEEMLSWLLYYLTLFQVEKSAATEIPDPVGLVQSQAIHSADRDLRIVLNSSPAGQTLVGRFLHAYGGAGVQHVSFATDDIFATARRLQELGMEPLPIPENYYYDLGARYGFEDTVLSRMAEHNILYDEDERGSYHHLYTRAFAKRFFFEVVQRRSYDGYGARDTAIRLAAQSRFRNLAPGVDLVPLHPTGHQD